MLGGLETRPHCSRLCPRARNTKLTGRSWKFALTCRFENKFSLKEFRHARSYPDL
jgi:hypothetical protein